MSLRAPLLAVAVAVAGAVLTAVPGVARAEPLRGPTLIRGDLAEVDPSQGWCSYRSATVRRWTPADGPPATVVTDIFLSPSSHEWVGLGADERGYWAAEVTLGDACDACASLTISHTGWDGARTVHWSLWRDGSEDPVALRRRVKAGLFALARGPWDLAKLRHDARMRIPDRDAEGNVKRFTGWMVEVAQRDRPLLRFAQTATPNMCWCDAAFRGYRLAAPSP